MSHLTPAETAPRSGRIVFLDLLRCLACFLVLVNHSITDVFFPLEPSPLWFTGVFGFFISKIAVPLFVMISGYTLLHKQDTYAKSGIRLLRTAICLVLFSGVYYLNLYFTGQLHNFGPVYFIGRILNRPVTNTFWYLYMYLGLLIMLPFLQKLCSVMEKRDYHIFFFWSGLFYAVYPIAEHFVPMLNYTDFFAVPLFGSHICMLLLGSYARKYFVPKKSTAVLALAIFFAMCGVSTLLTWVDYRQLGSFDVFFFDNVSLLPILLASVCIFYAASVLRFPDRIGRFLSSLGGCTFAMYLVSDLILEKLWFLFPGLKNMGVHPLLAVIALQVCVYCGCAAVAWCLKKLPGIRKLL